MSLDTWLVLFLQTGVGGVSCHTCSLVAAPRLVLPKGFQEWLNHFSTDPFRLDIGNASRKINGWKHKMDDEFPFSSG